MFKHLTFKKGYVLKKTAVHQSFIYSSQFAKFGPSVNVESGWCWFNPVTPRRFYCMIFWQTSVFKMKFIYFCQTFNSIQLKAKIVLQLNNSQIHCYKLYLHTTLLYLYTMASFSPSCVVVSLNKTPNGIGSSTCWCMNVCVTRWFGGLLNAELQAMMYISLHKSNFPTYLNSNPKTLTLPFH